jgi:uncharacterized RmlC-like cupin family protein
MGRARLVRAGDTYDGKQGLTYFRGIATETVGSKGICMHLLTIPPGGRAKAHMYENHETAIHILEGEVVASNGDRLRHHVITRGTATCSTSRPACPTSGSI